MDRRSEIVRRIAFLQAELEALAHLVDLTDELDAPAPARVAAPATAAAPAVVEEAPAAKAAPARKAGRPAKAKKVRWSYLPGTWYRISGDNPFRNGNNLVFFDHLKETFGSAPFSREQLAEAYEDLKKSGRIETVQTEDSYNLVFLRTAGQGRGAIEMVAKPGDDLPPEA